MNEGKGKRLWAAALAGGICLAAAPTLTATSHSSSLALCGSVAPPQLPGASLKPMGPMKIRTASRRIETGTDCWWEW